MPKDIHLAFDATVRNYDADGRLHILRTHISKAAVNPYYGREIPGWENLGLDPERVYQLLRHPDELAKGAATFARLPILAGHVPVNADDPQRERIAGAIGSNVEFSDPYLDADVCIWTAEDIAGIESNEVREFSCSYRYVPVMTPGEWQGQNYDGIMTEIVGNHLALVEAGRAGSDVLAADEDITMKMTKMGRALFHACGAMSSKVAQDSSLPGLVGQVTAKTAKAEELAPKIIAMDSALVPEKVTKTVSALFALDAEADKDDDEDDDTAEDSEEEKEKAAKDKKAKDAEKECAEKAMDAKIATMKQGLLDAEEAKRLVRPVVGEVFAKDSAEDIYAFALDHLKVNREGVAGTAALRALFNVAQTATATAAASPVAMDYAGVAEMFPEASRFGRR